MTTVGRFWTWYVVCLAVIVVAASLYGSAKGAELPKFEIADPICPTRLYIQQEYNTWARVNGRVVQVDRIAITHCYTQPKIVYRSAANKGAKREHENQGR